MQNAVFLGKFVNYVGTPPPVLVLLPSSVEVGKPGSAAAGRYKIKIIVHDKKLF